VFADSGGGRQARVTLEGYPPYFLLKSSYKKT
jgi:hypothetical protein